ncbi:MAG: type II toxin-antitoxin system VapC family toxin [Thermoplasmata archaeon]|nr:MAG: type II toxin-antitoxin system VapC family toxin [Thermoplasmata archaeon]
MKDIRSVSFDTSFLLRDDSDVDRVIKELKKDKIECFVTSTVISELEQLKVWGRIDEQVYKRAYSRIRRVNSKIIDFKNRFFSSEFGKECVASMGEHLGAKPKDVINDCNILVTGLKNGIDLFLSEDFHFTSKITESVLDEITNNACVEYHQMCGEEMYSVDTKTFLKVYNKGEFDFDTLISLRQEAENP